MKRTAAVAPLALLTLLLLVGCDGGPSPAAPAGLEIQMAKPTKSGGDTGSSLVADVVVGDAALDPADPSVLQSTCPGAVGKQWHVDFGHTGCLIVRPAGESATYGDYELTDDVKLVVTKENGKNGRITHVTLLGQDVIGDAGVAHETDPIPVAVPVVPSKDGFTLHVHAADVEVWRLSGHTGGDRVEVIGTIAIGDIVYRN